MPPGSESRGSKRAAAAGGSDHLSALPHALIQQVLSFLPSAEAVRTCVLGRGWRHLWKSVPAVRVTDGRRYGSPHALNNFVNTLLRLRDRRSPLDEVDIESYPSEEDEDYEESFRYAVHWIQYALSCKVRVLRFCNPDALDRLPLPCGLIASVSLKRLELFKVELKDPVLDFTSCPALEELKLQRCYIHAARIGGPSIRHLSIRRCDFYAASRTRISGRNLVYLLIADCWGQTPLLESMPSLMSAFVRIGDDDMCFETYEVGNCGVCGTCHYITDGGDTSVVLRSLSGCTSLELIADTRAFIFRRDLLRGPVFSKLKTVLLNDWCITANFDALICFLQHSPVLEKLTLQIAENILPNFVEVGAIYDVKKQPFATKHFTVEIKCEKVDDHILKIIEVLCSYGILSEQIKILGPPKQLDCFVDGDIWHGGSKYPFDT